MLDRNLTSAARLLVAQLRLHGVERVFCVPGESFLAVLDAFVDEPAIAVTTCRHEGGATMMAEAYAKATGQPAVVFVTRGPGATNGSSGMHVAKQDSTPIVLFIGDVDRGTVGRETFQEVDYHQMFAPLAKWVARVDDPVRLPELVGRAFQTATTGRPGPVVLALPEDMLTEEVAVLPSRAYAPVQPAFPDELLPAVEELLSQAQRPVVIAGGGGWSARASEDLRHFAEIWGLPVATSFRRTDYFDNSHALYAGSLGLGTNPALAEAVRQADLILAVGTRLGEASTEGFTLLGLPRPAQKLIHIHADAAELGKVYQPDLAINSGSASALRALRRTAPPRRNDRGWVEKLNAAYRAWSTPPAETGAVRMGEIITWLRDRLPADAVVTNGAGNFAIWPNRFHRHRRYGTMLAPTSGSMGYGVPAAVGAKLAAPGKMVVAFEGDGSFLMTGQELATAAREDAPIIVVLLNNGMYGTIRMHQERHYPGRVSATSLTNPDFQLLARAYGAHAERVAATEEFAPAFERAAAAGRSAVIEVVIDPEAIAPGQTISGLRRAAAR